MFELLIVSGSAIAVAGAVGVFVFLRRTKKASPVQQSQQIQPQNPYGKLGKLFSKAAPSQEWNELEETLLGADVGYATTQKILGNLKADPSNGVSLTEKLREVCETMLVPAKPLDFNAPPRVISVVGVNGVGKTTTIGKLAYLFRQENKKVLLGAIDTFRAAAISQLNIWAERTGSEFVTGREGADPGAVAFDAVSAAKARGIDIVLLDTAGRLHTKSNLMDELKKIHKVIKKVIPDAPHETWLVVDGTMGQNAIQQARQFQQDVELTGIVVTKLDGTARGGAVLGISSELGLPIVYAGVGEGEKDLLPFDRHQFALAICS